MGSTLKWILFFAVVVACIIFILEIIDVLTIQHPFSQKTLSIISTVLSAGQVGLLIWAFVLYYRMLGDVIIPKSTLLPPPQTATTTAAATAAAML